MGDYFEEVDSVGQLSCPMSSDSSIGRLGVDGAFGSCQEGRR